MWNAIVFDGDDTLWQTEWLYDAARRQARHVVEASGLDDAEWERLEREIDVANVERLGHSVARFPASCVEAYEALCAATGTVADPIARARVREAAQSAFTRQAPLVARARETLMDLQGRGIRLILLTKGDPQLQNRRIEQSGLSELFDVIEIVDQKTPESIRSVLERVGIPASEALSVGNSLRSDVTPSLAAGVQPVWIDAHVWEYERNHDDVPKSRVIELENLGRLIDVVVS